MQVYISPEHSEHSESGSQARQVVPITLKPSWQLSQLSWVVEQVSQGSLQDRQVLVINTSPSRQDIHLSGEP